MRNQDGSAPWSVVEDVTFTHNVLRHTSSGINLLGRDNNHPSIVGWGLAQGMNAYSPASLDYIRGLERFIHSYGNQAVYASAFDIRSGEDVGPVDFLAADIFPAGKETAEQNLKYLSTLSTEKPLLISSIGYPVQSGNYNGSSDPLSIDAQGQFFLDMYGEVRAKRFAGMIAHTFADWTVTIPLMSADRVYEFTNTSGIMDRWRMKRIAYDVLKAKFNNEKPPVVVTGKFDAEHPAAFVVIGIVLILLFAVVYNLFRRFRENVVRSFLRPYNFFADVRDQRMLSIFQTSVVGLLGALLLRAHGFATEREFAADTHRRRTCRRVRNRFFSPAAL